MSAGADAALEVVRAGALTTVQDLGRLGLAHLGVPRSGAADMDAHLRANALVGNGPGAATLETTATGCALRVHGEAVVAVEGAPCRVRVGDVPAPWGAPVRLRAGQVLEVGAAVDGLRSYVAVRGGVDADVVLGSRSTDLLSGLGPAPLRVGVTLAVGSEADGEPAFATMGALRSGGTDGGAPGLSGAAVTEMSVAHHAPAVELPLVLGPRADWFTARALAALGGAEYVVTSESNRVGLRLDGPPLHGAHAGELPSEGMVLGAVQVPPSGLPVVFLADHPTTGGYPVVGVVTREGVGRASQAAPGSRVRFAIADSRAL